MVEDFVGTVLDNTIAEVWYLWDRLQFIKDRQKQGN